MNLQKVQINSIATSNDLVKILDTKVSISSVKQVLYWHNLNIITDPKPPFKKKRNRLWFVIRDKDLSSKKIFISSNETKKLFGHKGFHYVWKLKRKVYKMKDIIQTLKHRDGRSILWGYFAAEGNGSLHKTDHIMRKRKYRDMLKQLQPEILDLFCKWSLPNWQLHQEYFQSYVKMV